MKHAVKQSQQGLTMLVVLVLLSVMLLGGLALARMTEVGTLAAGNAAFKETALQASEIGINTAFAAVQSQVTNENANIGNWYFAARQTDDDRGVPEVDFDNEAEVRVGAYTLNYVVDRVCSVAAVTDPLRECLLKQEPVHESNSYGVEKVDPPTARQFRVTVRATGPKGTRVWVQSMLTKGNVAPTTP